MLDPTFRTYAPKQAASYAAHRSSYSADIYQEIISYHSSHGGELDLALDVGCGTGGATRKLGTYFAHVIGCDPGQEMIAQASQLGGETRTGEHVGYEILNAEDLDKSQLLKPGSVDLLTAAMAAHWFNMDTFWPQAARMVKPGGTVALWTKSSLYCHPSTSNAEAVQRILNHLEDDVLGPYELPANNISRNMYTDLSMPWSAHPSIDAFPQSLFVRNEWNRDGKLEPGSQDFFEGSAAITLEKLAGSLGTASMVTRWRQNHPKLSDTDDDCVIMTMKAVAKAMGAQSQDLGATEIKVGSATTLLLFTRTEDTEYE